MNNVEPVDEYEACANQWYKTPAVKFEIVNAVKFRETILLAKNRKLTHRCLKNNAVRFLDKHFERYHFYDRDYLYNVYNSVARFPYMPMFSFNWNEKMEEQKKFNENFRDYITTYDLVFDLDNPDFELVYSSSYWLKDLLDRYKIKYWLKFSGTKGFHFIVDFYDLPDRLKKLDLDTLCHMFKLFAYEIRKIHKIMDLDTTIYDLRRIIKTPYTVVYPYYYVALPLTDSQFENFTHEMVHISKLCRYAEQMKKRGLLKRHINEDNDMLLKLMYDVAEQSKNDALFAKLKKIDKPYLYTEFQKIFTQ